MNVTDDELGTLQFNLDKTINTKILPPELLVYIFSFLSSTTDLRNCILVCKGWAQCGVELLWLRPIITSLESLDGLLNTIESNSPLLDYKSLIRRLNLTYLKNALDDAYLARFAVCTKLERLTIGQCKMITAEGLNKVLLSNKAIVSMDISGIPSLDDSTLLKICQSNKNIHGLNVSNCDLISNNGMLSIVMNCPELRRLKMQGCNLITDQVLALIARHLIYIIEVDVVSCHLITDFGVRSLIHNIPVLRELRLANCTNITDNSFKDLPFLGSLRVLDVSNCFSLTDSSVGNIINAAPKLRYLCLAKCINITDRAVRHITKLGKNLHFLHLGHCSNITDASIIELARNCTRIRYLDLACCMELTDASFVELAAILKLKRIGLVKCVNITDASIYALITEKSIQSTLERVHLSHCHRITPIAILQLLNLCPKLSHLSLTGIAAFLLPEITRFCRLPPAEFTQTQRDVFCVFSGSGIFDLKEHLNGLARQNRMRIEPPPIFMPNDDDDNETTDNEELF